MAFGDRPKKITSSVIGYQLAPRINAAGRIDSALRAVELLLTDSVEEAERLAAKLTGYKIDIKPESEA